MHAFHIVQGWGATRSVMIATSNDLSKVLVFRFFSFSFSFFFKKK